MSVGFMLNSRNDAIVWRGPRKNGLIRQFLTDVNWADVNILLVDSLFYFISLIFCIFLYINY